MTVLAKPTMAHGVWADRGETITPSNAKVATGWVVEIPPHQIFNWWMKRADAFIAHNNQRGVPAWDAATQYYSSVSYVTGPENGLVYRAITTNTGVNPETDTNGNWQVAFEAAGNSLLKAQNLADVPNKALARQNLGISTTSDYDVRYLQRSQNLADVPNKSAARSNLGLGNSATTNVGTTAGTVAAGNDPRIVNATPNGRSVTAGAGLVGGGNLTTDRSIGMGTPSHVSAYSGNTVSGTTHTHALDIASLFQYSHNNPGWRRTPDGLTFQWGYMNAVAPGGVVRINFPRPFTWAFSVVASSNRVGISSRVSAIYAGGLDNNGFTITHDFVSGASAHSGAYWIAIGYS